MYITPDLTSSEQENNKKLRQELNTLNKDGKKYMIKKQCGCAEESLADPFLCTDEDDDTFSIHMINKNSSIKQNKLKINKLSLNCCSVRRQSVTTIHNGGT